jgi:hypothetical protein
MGSTAKSCETALSESGPAEWSRKSPVDAPMRHAVGGPNGQQAVPLSSLTPKLRPAIRVGGFKASDVPIVHQEIVIVSRGPEVAERTPAQTPARDVLHVDVPNVPAFLPQLDLQKFRRECLDGSAFDF